MRKTNAQLTKENESLREAVKKAKEQLEKWAPMEKQIRAEYQEQIQNLKEEERRLNHTLEHMNERFRSSQAQVSVLKDLLLEKILD